MYVDQNQGGQQDFNRVIVYDRVLNEKSNFEIPAFFMFEQGKSRAGKFKPM